MTLTSYFDKVMETETEHKARIIRDRPDLAGRPILTREPHLHGLIVHLEHNGRPLGVAVTVIDESHEGGGRTRLPDGRMLRWAGWYRAVVIASTNPDYPVGGHDLAISEEEIRRSPRASIVAEQQSE